MEGEYVPTTPNSAHNMAKVSPAAKTVSPPLPLTTLGETGQELSSTDPPSNLPQQVNINRTRLQGDQAACYKPPVDFDLKVAF